MRMTKCWIKLFVFLAWRQKAMFFYFFPQKLNFQRISQVPKVFDLKIRFEIVQIETGCSDFKKPFCLPEFFFLFCPERNEFFFKVDFLNSLS